MRKLILVLILLIAFPCFGADYYVDTACPDNNAASATVDGSGYNPATHNCSDGGSDYYVTIADLNAKSFSGDDNIYFRKGQTWTLSAEWLLNDSGTSGHPITVDAFGTGNDPIIDGDDSVTAMDIAGNWININNMRFTQGIPNIRMYDGADNINITGCEMDNSPSSHGMNYNGQDLVITDSIFHDNGANDTDHGIYVDNCSSDTANVTIDSSAFYDNSGDQIKINDCNNADNITGIIIRYTYAQAEGEGNAILDGASEGAQIYYNYFYSKADHDLALIRIQSGEEATEDANSHDIYNNVFHHTPVDAYYAIRIDSADNDGIDIRNNIFYSAGSAAGFINSASGAIHTACDNNLYYGSGTKFQYGGSEYADLAAYVAGTAWGDNSHTGDPKFTNAGTHDYSIQSDSPARDEGVDVSLSLDYIGTTVPQGPLPDMGAYEYIAGEGSDSIFGMSLQ